MTESHLLPCLGNALWSIAEVRSDVKSPRPYTARPDAGASLSLRHGGFVLALRGRRSASDDATVALRPSSGAIGESLGARLTSDSRSFVGPPDAGLIHRPARRRSLATSPAARPDGQTSLADVLAAVPPPWRWTFPAPMGGRGAGTVSSGGAGAVLSPLHGSSAFTLSLPLEQQFHLRARI